MTTKFERRLINVEIELGFLRIGSNFVSLFPREKARLEVFLDDNIKPTELTFNNKTRRIYGLTAWFRKHDAKPNDKVEIEKLADKSFRFSFKKHSEAEEPVLSTEEAKEILDLSGLSSAAKGDLVEDRIKELILLYGQGLLAVYKPASDTEGIDLVIVKNGVFQPLFLQVKGRYTLNNSSIISDVRLKTFNPHHTYYVVVAYFDPLKLEVSENILLIPTEKVVELANIVNARGDKRHRIVARLNERSKGKWAPYLCRKNLLATKLLEKFEEIERYVK